MPEPLPDFLTVKAAATRAMRSVDTIRRWIRAGFLWIVAEPTRGTFNHSAYVIAAEVLDVCIAKAERLIPLDPGDRWMPAKPHVASSRLATQRWRAKLTPKQREELRRKDRAYKARVRDVNKRLRAMRQEKERQEAEKAQAGKRKRSGPRVRTRRR